MVGSTFLAKMQKKKNEKKNVFSGVDRGSKTPAQTFNVYLS